MRADNPKTRRKGRRIGRSLNERGVALIIVVVAIAVLTAVATDFAYNSRVDLQLATNQRDEVRAYYLARSGLGLSRLLLKFQRQLDSMPLNIPGLSDIMGALGGGATGAAGAAGAAGTPAAPTSLNIQLWKMARVDCHMLRGLVKSDTSAPGELPIEGAKSRSGKFGFDEEFPEVAGQQEKKSFGGFEGCFLSTITDEEERINLARLDAPQLTAQPTVLALMQLLNDKRFAFLFETEDANRVKVNPQDVIVNIKDWIDEDTTGATLNLSGTGDVFQNGFADENYNYDRYNPRYKAKNGHFDSLDELYMVHGVNDRFMAAFGDRFTVYPDVNRNINVNTDDPLLLYLAVLAVSDPVHPDPRLQDPLFVEALIKQIKAARMFSFLGTSVADFVNAVQAAGVPVNQTITQNVANNRLVSDKSQTYRIRTVGEAGQVQKTITAVVRLDDGLGKLLYWREE